jgi:hypothetical protein
MVVVVDSSGGGGCRRCHSYSAFNVTLSCIVRCVARLKEGFVKSHRSRGAVDAVRPYFFQCTLCIIIRENPIPPILNYYNKICLHAYEDFNMGGICIKMCTCQERKAE